MKSSAEKKSPFFSGVDVLYQHGFGKVDYYPNVTRFSRPEQNEQESSMTLHHIMPGLEISYNHFNSHKAVEVSYAPETLGVIEINHCRQGRFGCVLQNDRYVYLGEGEIEANILGIVRVHPEFPLGFYDGFSILLDVRLFSDAIAPLFPTLSAQLFDLKKRIETGGGAVLIRPVPELNLIFEEMYHVNPAIEKEYIKLKVLELLFLLQTLPYERDTKKTGCFRRSDIEKVKVLHEEAIARLEERIPLKTLAEKYGLGLTLTKSCFKEIYGNPYYTYMKHYRIHKAVHYLEEGQLSVAEVGGMIGYDNASKFSAAFRSIMGCTPREYRKKADHMEHLNLLGVEID